MLLRMLGDHDTIECCSVTLEQSSRDSGRVPAPGRGLDGVQTSLSSETMDLPDSRVRSRGPPYAPQDRPAVDAQYRSAA